MNTGNGRFALILFIFVLFIVFTSPIYAASENSGQKTTVSPTQAVRMYDSVTPAPNNTSQTVDYTLPYPGLLPDSPLYFLKTFRDRLISFFISSPIKKAD